MFNLYPFLLSNSHVFVLLSFRFFLAFTLVPITLCHFAFSFSLFLLVYLFLSLLSSSHLLSSTFLFLSPLSLFPILVLSRFSLLVFPSLSCHFSYSFSLSSSSLLLFHLVLSFLSLISSCLLYFAFFFSTLPNLSLFPLLVHSRSISSSRPPLSLFRSTTCLLSFPLLVVRSIFLFSFSTLTLSSRLLSPFSYFFLSSTPFRFLRLVLSSFSLFSSRPLLLRFPFLVFFSFSLSISRSISRLLFLFLLLLYPSLSSFFFPHYRLTLSFPFPLLYLSLLLLISPLTFPLSLPFSISSSLPLFSFPPSPSLLCHLSSSSPCRVPLSILPASFQFSPPSFSC